MIRSTFLCLCPHDCADEVEVTVEQVMQIGSFHGMSGAMGLRPVHRLVTFPSSCKCGAPIHVAEPSQEELRIAYHLPEAEDV